VTGSPELQSTTTTDRRDGTIADCAATDTCILALYHELLQREPAGTELEEWRHALLSGVTTDQVRAAFIASDEYRQQAEVAERKAAVSRSGLFDPDWYLATYADVASAGLDPLEHYCRYGAREHRMPNAWFDDRWYRKQTGIAANTNAILDYAMRGERLGIGPGPHFDPAWYRTTYRLDDAASPLAHFLAHRASRAFAPCPRLWSVAHSPLNAASPSETDPLLPFLTPGQDPAQGAAPDIQLLRSAGLFDENHYQVTNDDVLSSGIDPLTHYCAFGWKEGRNPNFYFDSRWYTATNPEVARLQVNPLVHYLLVGEAADRRPVVFFEPGWYRRTYCLSPDVSPLAHYLAHRRTPQFSPNSLFDPSWYLTQCGEAPHARRDLFAHYLLAGMRTDVRPVASFDAAAWRRRTRGRPTRHFQRHLSPESDNPLVNYMLAHYR
jgi:hypothetical protein